MNLLTDFFLFFLWLLFIHQRGVLLLQKPGLFAAVQLLSSLYFFSSKVSSGEAGVSRQSGAGTICVSVKNHCICFKPRAHVRGKFGSRPYEGA